jgi:hypothetical protein
MVSPGATAVLAQAIDARGEARPLFESLPAVLT